MAPRDLPRYSTFAEFWPFYVEEHSDPRNRRLHFIGTMLAVAALALAVATGQFIFLVLVPIVGYGFAWFGHLYLQKNTPATFRYPVYSLRGDAQMFGLMLVGKMDGVVVEVRNLSKSIK